MSKAKAPRRAQGGIALIVGLIFLLVITVIGLAAVRGTSEQSLMTANYQFQTTTFQAAESGIRTVFAEVLGNLPTPAGQGNILVTALTAATDGATPPPVRNFDGSVRVNEKGVVLVSNDNDPSTPDPIAVNSTATMIAENPDGGGRPLTNYSLDGQVTQYRFSIISTSALANTNATVTNQQGIFRLGPRG